MSFLSGLPQLASILAQPAVLAAGVATGVAVGAVGVGTGVIPVTDPGPRLTPVYECPGSGRVLTSLEPDQKVLVTARNADGTWLELYIGQPGAERAWAPAKALQLRAAPDSLPVDDCSRSSQPPTPLATLGPPTEAPSSTPSGAPETAAATGGTPTPAATKTPAPTRTPKPTATPLTGPVLSDISLYAPAQEGDGVYRIYYRDSTYCPYAWNNVGLTVASADAQGTASVTLYFQATGSSVQSVAMTNENGLGTLWDGGFDAAPDWTVGALKVWMQAVDNDGNLGPKLDLKSAGYNLAVGNCVPAPTPSPTPTP